MMSKKVPTAYVSLVPCTADVPASSDMPEYVRLLIKQLLAVDEDERWCVGRRATGPSWSCHCPVAPL